MINTDGTIQWNLSVQLWNLYTESDWQRGQGSSFVSEVPEIVLLSSASYLKFNYVDKGSLYLDIMSEFSFHF